MRWLLLCACLFPAFAHARPIVRGFALPARRADLEDLSRRANEVAAAVARALGGVAADRKPAARRGDLSAEVDRASTLALDVKLAAAADVLDRALAAGEKTLDDNTEARAWVTGHLARVSIALARNEVDVVARLLDRAVRFDPALTLQGDEDRPRMSSALASAKTRVQLRSQITDEDVRGACDEREVLIVVRGLDVAKVSARFEAFRFDGCRLSASAAGVDTSTVAAELTRTGSAVSLSAKETSPKTLRWAALGVGVAGVALLAAGTGLAGSAGADYAELQSTCGESASCAPGQWEGARARERAGYSLIGIGGAAAVTGLILWLVERRHPRSALTMRAVVTGRESPPQSFRSTTATR